MTEIVNARSKPIDIGGGRWLGLHLLTRQELSALRRGDRAAFAEAKARADAAAAVIAQAKAVRTKKNRSGSARIR